MRKMLVLSLALMALLGFVAPPDVFAQAAAPTPKATITGFIDNVGTWTQNMSTSDLSANRNRDNQVYGRTRGRFDIVGEVGQAKAVFGFEIDSYWGQTGFIDSNNGPGCATASSGAVTCGAVGTGSESSFDLNTDTQGNFQVKWLYTEFPMPLVPIPVIVRLGAQPAATAASYKLAPYFNGDFGGVNFYATFSPTFKTQFTYVAVDENLLGKGAFGPFLNTTQTGGTLQNKCINTAGVIVASSGCQAQSRGDNWALIGSPEITVMKGLDIKPMLSTFRATGLTSSAARQGRGGVSILNGGPFAPINSASISGGPGVGGADGAGTGVHENRHTIGIDARWRSGPWSVDPTVYYQFGTQEKWLQAGIAGSATNPYGAVGGKRSADISALLFDIRTSYQLGPLLLSHMVMATSGDQAKSNPYKKIGYYTPLDTDTGYMADWGTQIMSLGVDYYQIIGAANNNPGVSIGWDKYGRISTGVKASYAWTPSLTVGAGITPNWTWAKVDNDAYLVTGGGLQPSFYCRKTLTTCTPQGDNQFLGTEFNLALTYRFAPGLVFDWAAGYMMSDNAMAHRYVNADYNVQAPVRRDIGINPIAITTARVRFSF
ncbi:MAG TPA: hypothetical protein VMI34_05390 [Candidatus Bathyarchaeia archaeon]|nr:hypothetical protein [Candidatus Bathyarchaeia archaeon]